MPDRSERLACDVCDAPVRPVRIQDGHSIYGASGCRGHQQINVGDATSHVQTVYSDDYFLAGGAGYNDYVKDGFVLEAHGRRHGRILRRYLPRQSRVLDVGAAAGFIAAGIRSVGFQVTGVEPNETMARYARSHLDVDVHGGSLESFVPQEPLDAICFVQVLEHLKSPRHEVSRLAAQLKPGGLVLVETWDMHSVPAKLLGPRWHQYSPPSVVHWFSAATLRSMFRSLGFEVVDSGRPLKFITLRHGLSLLAHKFPGLRFISSIAEGPIGRIRFPYPPLDLRWFVFRKTGEAQRHD